MKQAGNTTLAIILITFGFLITYPLMEFSSFAGARNFVNIIQILATFLVGSLGITFIVTGVLVWTLQSRKFLLIPLVQISLILIVLGLAALPAIF